MEPEVEDVFIICSDNPKIRNRDTYGDIVKIRNWDNLFTLIPGNSQNFRDIYFDTTKHALQAIKVSLRIRQLNGENVITLKISGGYDTITGRNDLEIERHWTQTH